MNRAISIFFIVLMIGVIVSIAESPSTREKRGGKNGKPKPQPPRQKDPQPQSGPEPTGILNALGPRECKLQGIKYAVCVPAKHCQTYTPQKVNAETAELFKQCDGHISNSMSSDDLQKSCMCCDFKKIRDRTGVPQNACPW